MNNTEQLASDAFTEAQRMFTSWCRYTQLKPDASELKQRFSAQWKKPSNPAVVLKLCVYWDGQRIGTVLVRHDLGRGRRIFVLPNGWREA
jgi:hypothetical protein